MSIRYRLFLIVGLVSSFVFIFAFFLNNQMFRSNIKKTQEEGAVFERKIIEQRKIYVEELVRDDIAKKLAQINALLETVSQFPSLSEWFSPSPKNLKQGTWAHAAYFLQNEDWIQFLQNTSNSEVLSLILPDKGPFFSTETLPLEEGISWIFIPESKVYKDPCLGVQLPFKAKEEKFGEEGSFAFESAFPVVHIIYSLEKLKTFVFSKEFFQDKGEVELDASVQGYEVDAEKFYAFFNKAIALAKDPHLKIPTLSDLPPKAPQKEEKPPEKLSEVYLKDILSYSSELFLLGEVTSLQEQGFFGVGPSKINWPDAMSFAKKTGEAGQVFFLNTVFNSTPFFTDEDFFEKNPPKEGSYVSSGGAILPGSHPNQVLFVNTAAIYTEKEGERKRSLLTIGFDMTDFLYNLVTVSNHYGCLVAGSQVLCEITPQGSPPIAFKAIPGEIAKINQDAGTIVLGDVEYFFITVKPDPSLDFYFCSLSPKTEALSLFNSIHNKISGIISHLWIQKLILEICSLLILWLFLLDLSKKITNPIVALSNSLKYVKTGQWDKVKIPESNFRKNNEIKQLVNSFHDMVEGMKEKEKMSGILNKVVSKEIAQEILKGEIHLGGEERVVTMLFTDIRGFTQLTQNMPPHEVIALLNTCMTKLSQVIEDHKGVIDKYLGDGIMALYGAPVSYKESPLYAVVSGLEMIRIIQEWDEERIKKGEVPLNIGIGIHTGTVCAGNMGAQNRLNYTVIGSHVNMASRLCYAAGPGELLISADTYMHPSVEQNVEVEDKGFMSFKGFDEKKQVYRVLRLKDPSLGNVLILQDEV